MSRQGWEFWIDVGGTFTDCIAKRPDGALTAHKLLSTGVYKATIREGSTRSRLLLSRIAIDPENYFRGFTLSSENTRIAHFDATTGASELANPLSTDPRPGTLVELSCEDEAPIVGIRWLMGKELSDPIGEVSVKLGTTRGTNALLQRRGARTAFVTTKGFADVLRIATQNRPRLFDLEIRRPGDLFEEVIEIDERIDADGSELRAVQRDDPTQQLSAAKNRGITSLAICFLHSYRNAEHEQQVGAIARQLGFQQVSLSSQLAPIQRIVPRGDTTVVDAYLSPIIGAYVSALQQKLPEANLQLMTSAGTLVDAREFVGKDSILSGPAGGIVAVARIAHSAGYTQPAIGFDMGGTSTDVSRYAGEFERRYEMEFRDPDSDAGVRIVAPMLAIETVAAGGGSLCWFDGQRLRVGPQSAGSSPGPACYGRNGPLTVTDCNVALGRIIADRFNFPLDVPAVTARLQEIQSAVLQQAQRQLSVEEIAIGFLEIANANMAAAIRRISTAKGHDLRKNVLISFGGAGGQHACALARELKMQHILQPKFGGLFSALGIGTADVTRFAQRHVGAIWTEELQNQLAATFSELEQEVRDQLLSQSLPIDKLRPPRRMLDLRYKGQDSFLTIERTPDADFPSVFEKQHKHQFGFAFPGRPVEVLSQRLELTAEGNRYQVKPGVQNDDSDRRTPQSSTRQSAYFAGTWHTIEVYLREALNIGDTIDGPAIIAEPYATLVIEPGWRAIVDRSDDISLTAMAEGTVQQSRLSTDYDPVALELFNNRFTSIADQMGETLRRTAISTNVKERLDFSCALFTRSGELVVNAPHIPVHLGAMGATVKAMIELFPEMRPGDAFLTNDPFRGGSHLPDVTAVTPVFDSAGKEVLFFTASRAHHAEIGGITPGSMPPFSQKLSQEGVLIRAFRIVEGEQASEESLRNLLLTGPYPTRSVEENLADTHAQLAANQTGVRLLSELVEQQGLAVITAFMDHCRRAAERKMRWALGRLTPGMRRFEDSLDNGARIVVQIEILHDENGGAAIVDFTGTDSVLSDNFNANPAIVRSAVLYCLRCMINEDIPLNDGVLAPVKIRIPKNCFLNPSADPDPEKCPAVVGGNVETSQRVVDVILGALGLVAASQGTMNNFLFGRPMGRREKPFGYYETIAGGAGAGPGFPGANAVHTHMTNTRLTDVEVLEARYPVLVRQLAIRRGSGGEGKHRGGDGIVREIEFLDALEVSLLTNRRTTAPFGLAGGQAGKPGANLLKKKDATQFDALPSSTQFSVEPGDVLRIETPGGGGYGNESS